VNLRSGVGTRTRTAIVVTLPPNHISLRACRRFRQAVSGACRLSEESIPDEDRV
jgi:hypothetical protein